MQLKLLVVSSLLCGATLTASEVKAVPQGQDVSWSLQTPGCKPYGLTRNWKRTALLIANQDYEELDVLSTPITDAKGVGDRLVALGFEVTLCTNLKSYEIGHITTQYTLDIEFHKANELSVFYFAGHGSQDVLYGVDHRLSEQVDDAKRHQPARISELLASLDPDTNRRGSAAVMIIDACRMPSQKQVQPQASKAGATAAASPDGSFVVYSTAPGTVASDAPLPERQGHSLFAAELLAELDTNPTSDVDKFFREVRKRVKAASQKKQVPWTTHSLVTTVSFKEVKSG